MSLLESIGGEKSLSSALGRWCRHVQKVLSSPEDLGVAFGAVALLEAAGGEVSLNSSWGRWARKLSQHLDTALVDLSDINQLLLDADIPRSAEFQWALKSSSERSTPYGYLTSLKGWWDATDLQGLSSIGDWFGKAGNNELLVDQGTLDAVVNTGWVGGRTQVVLNTTTNWMKCTTPEVATVPNGEDSPYSVILTFQPILNDTTYRGVWGFGSASAGYTELLTDNLVGGEYIIDKADDATGGGGQKIGSGGVKDTNPHIAIVINTGVTGSLWIDGALIVDDVDLDKGSMTSDTFSLCALFRSGSGVFPNRMNVAELEIYNIALSTSAREREQARLSSKWEVSLV